MADQKDVADALVREIGSYLVGETFLPTLDAYQTRQGDLIKIGYGWPVGEELAQEVNQTPPVTWISIYPVSGLGSNTTRYFRDEITTRRATQTLFISASGNTATLTGLAGPGQIVGIGYGRVGWTHRVLGSDTPESILDAFRARIPGSSRTGTTLTLPTSQPLIARVGLEGTSTTLLSQESQVFQITIWAANPDLRERLGSQVKVAMARIRDLLMPDGIRTGVPRLTSSMMSDRSGTEDVWKRDMRWSIDYSTTLVEEIPPVVFIGGTITSISDTKIADWGQQPPDAMEGG
jgi:hypothetical protein